MSAELALRQAAADSVLLKDVLLALFAVFAGALVPIMLHRRQLMTRTLIVLTTLSGVAVAILYVRGFIENRDILILLGGAVVILCLALIGRRPLLPSVYHRYRDLPTYLLSRIERPTTSDIEATATRVKLPTGEPFLSIPDRSLLDGRYPSIPRRRSSSPRPYVFAKMKPRLYLPWLDATYYLVLRDLKCLGCAPIIYLYDFDLQAVDSHLPQVPSANDLSGALLNTQGYIANIVGCGATVIKGSRYFRQRRSAQQLHDFLYSEVFPTLAQHVVKRINEPVGAAPLDARSLLFELHGYPTILVAKLLARRRPVYALQWEGRADKWGLTAHDQDIQVLVSRTLATAGRPLRIRQGIHMTDGRDVLLDKLRRVDEYGGAEELRLMCALLLYRDDPSRYDWRRFVTSASIIDIRKSIHNQTSEGFLDLTTRASIEPALSGGELSAEARLSMEGSTTLAMAYLKHAVYQGVRAFQSDYGLAPHVAP